MKYKDLSAEKKARAIAATRRWQLKNRAKVKVSHAKASRAYVARHPDRVRDAQRAWEKRNPAQCAERCARRAARKRNGTPALTSQEQAEVIALYAKARALTELIGEAYHVDHIKPLSKGGLHHPSNLQVLRGIDNIRKGNRYE